MYHLDHDSENLARLNLINNKFGRILFSTFTLAT
jgi:hypothetical protein